MAEILNLRRARKNKARASEAAEAEANRAKHGVPLRVRKQEHAKREKAGRDLERLRLIEDDGK
jgi:hypothetical protein